MMPVRPGDAVTCRSCLRETRPGVTPGRGHLQAHHRARECGGRSDGPGAPTRSCAGAIPAPRRPLWGVEGARASRSPACGMPPPRSSPTRAGLFFEDRRIGEPTDFGRTPSAGTRSSLSRGSSIRSPSTSTRRRRGPRFSVGCVPPAGIRGPIHARQRHGRGSPATGRRAPRASASRLRSLAGVPKSDW